VTPGQFPTNWLEPVSALKSVVLPLLGFPARAILTDMIIPPKKQILPGCQGPRIRGRKMGRS